MSARQVPVARPFGGEDDVGRMLALLRAEAGADGDGLTVSEEDLRFEWVDDEPGWVRDLQIWEAGDRFVAASGAWHETADGLNRAYGEVHAHPDWREPVFVDEVVQAAVDAAADLIERPVDFRIGSTGSQNWLQGGLERADFAVDRYYFRMSATVGDVPEPSIPEGFTIRPLAGDAEVETWVEVFNAAFADHHDPPTTTIEEKRRRMNEAGYLPEADLVLVDRDGRMVGVGRNSVELLEDGGQKPWINSVALLPEFRGKGLGRAALLASMKALRDAGFEHVHLTVDADNPTGALELYTRVGFTVDTRSVFYIRAVEPAFGTA